MTPEQATIQALQNELIRAYEDKAREHSRWQSVHADYVNLRERYYELERSIADKLPQVESVEPDSQVEESELPEGVTVDKRDWCGDYDKSRFRRLHYGEAMPKEYLKWLHQFKCWIFHFESFIAGYLFEQPMPPTIVAINHPITPYKP